MSKVACKLVRIYLDQADYCCSLLLRGGPPVRLDIYGISLLLEGSVEDTPGFGKGSVRMIPRERPSTMMGRRNECGERALSPSSLRLLGWRQPLRVHETTYETDNKQQVVLEYARLHPYNKMQIYDLGEWWDLRGTTSMGRSGREPGTNVVCVLILLCKENITHHTRHVHAWHKAHAAKLG